MKKDKTKRVEDALYKRATGYSTKEVISEYLKEEDGDCAKLLKQRVTEKEIPPDISAMKLYLELLKGEEEKDVKIMTDEEIKSEKIRLIKLLKEIEDGNNEN